MPKPIVCPKCRKISLWENKGISKSSGKPYHNVKCKECGYLEWITSTLVKTTESPTNDFQKKDIDNYGQSTTGQKAIINKFNFEQFVADEFMGLNKRLDDLGEYLKIKFSTKKVEGLGTNDIEVNIKDREF